MVAAYLALIAFAGTPQVAALDGSLHRPLAENYHRSQVLVFISHDCPICNTYAPELQRIAKKYRKSVSFSLVYAEPNLNAAAAKKHFNDYAYTGFHAFLDPGGELSKFVGATITPEAALYDWNGKLAYLGRIDDLYIAYGKQRQHASNHDLRDALDAVLAHRSVAKAHTTSVGCFIATK